jgi:3-oxoacyl-(acyl-carrier-protein) synthase
MNRIAITGIGVISAIGDSVEVNHNALIKSECGLSSLQLFKTIYSDALKFGEIKIETERLKNRLNINLKGITRTSLLALHALKEAVNDSKLSDAQIESYDTALIVANTVGGMCLTDELYKDSNSTDGGSEYVGSYDCGSTTLFLQQQLGVKGVCNTINTACSSSANAIMFAARLINNGYANRAIVGGADSLAKFTINGFNSLGILAPQNCKPFDKDRNGLNLGEGSGFIVMEKESDALNKNIYAILSGYYNSNDAFHPSALSDNGDGPYLAMRGSLIRANLSPAQIGFINTHGTGTENNDKVESTALLRIFENVPPFVSTKSKIGHCLGAAASIESVFSIISLNNQEIYPSLNFENPIESTGLMPLLEYKKYTFDHIMTNSFGFGGNCSSLIFSKI